MERGDLGIMLYLRNLERFLNLTHGGDFVDSIEIDNDSYEDTLGSSCSLRQVLISRYGFNNISFLVPVDSSSDVSVDLLLDGDANDGGDWLN